MDQASSNNFKNKRRTTNSSMILTDSQGKIYRFKNSNPDAESAHILQYYDEDSSAMRFQSMGVLEKIRSGRETSKNNTRHKTHRHHEKKIDDNKPAGGDVIVGSKKTTSADSEARNTESEDGHSENSEPARKHSISTESVNLVPKQHGTSTPAPLPERTTISSSKTDDAGAKKTDENDSGESTETPFGALSSSALNGTRNEKTETPRHTTSTDDRDPKPHATSVAPPLSLQTTISNSKTVDEEKIPEYDSDESTDTPFGELSNNTLNKVQKHDQSPAEQSIPCCNVTITGIRDSPILRQTHDSHPPAAPKSINDSQNLNIDLTPIIHNKFNGVNVNEQDQSYETHDGIMLLVENHIKLNLFVRSKKIKDRSTSVEYEENPSSNQEDEDATDVKNNEDENTSEKSP